MGTKFKKLTEEDRDMLQRSVNLYTERLTQELDEMSLGVNDCPLCRFYNRRDYSEAVVVTNCAGCPVREHTGKCGCIGSPYDPDARKEDNDLESVLYKLCDQFSDGDEVADSRLRLLEERDFLQSLLDNDPGLG